MHSKENIPNPCFCVAERKGSIVPPLPAQGAPRCTLSYLGGWGSLFLEDPDGSESFQCGTSASSPVPGPEGTAR